MGQVSRGPRKARRHEQAAPDAGVGESLERPEPHRRHGRARLHLPDQRHVHRVEGDVNLEVASLLNAPQHVGVATDERSEEHTSELQSPCNLVCRLLLEKKKKKIKYQHIEKNEDKM